MSTHTIYSWHGNPRGDIARIAAEFAKVDYEFINTTFAELKSEQFLAKHPLGKVPLLETPEGSLTETHAILNYFGKKANLLGSSVFEEAQVQQWLSWINSDFVQHQMVVYGSVLGFFPLDEAKYKEAKKSLFEKLRYLNDYLTHHTFLAGEQISTADIALVSWVAPLFWTTIDENTRKAVPSLTRWFKHILSYAPVKKFFRAPFLCKKEWIQVKADKKEAAPKKDKKVAEKKVEKKAEVVVDVVPKAAKNPLDLLPESKFNLFDFKTYIVNETDKAASVAEFWKQFDAEGFSIWNVKYDKYEGEGEKLYLTSNLKDSFLQRLDHFRKYVFGTYGVYGEAGNYDVEGVWVWRGTEIAQEIKDLPNYEYHFWTRLDHTKEEDRARLTAFWTGLEEDVSVVDGKVARDVQYFK